MSSNLALADAYARAALAHADDVPALRETLDDVRERLDEARKAPTRYLVIILGVILALTGASAAGEFVGPLWPRAVVMGFALALPFVVVRAVLRRLRMPDAPVPNASLRRLLDGLAEAVHGTERHLEAAVARAWVLGNGDASMSSGEQPSAPRQPDASRFEAHVLDQTAHHVHTLLHGVTGTDARSRHRLARYDHLHRRLLAATALLRGGHGAPRRRTRTVLLVLVLLVLLTATIFASPWWLVPLIVSAGTLFNVLVGTFRSSCPLPVTDPWDEPRLRAAIERHLTDVARLPGEPAARAAADLAAARDLLDHP